MTLILFDLQIFNILNISLSEIMLPHGFEGLEIIMPFILSGRSFIRSVVN